MANPVIKTTIKDEWTKVASNVTAGIIKRIDKSPTVYLETYRMNDDPVPTSADEGVPCFINSDSEIIEASAGIDVYIFTRGANGEVRVDLP